jgi:phosphoribosyl-ATP pyrophosphohydrolase|tara:strand:+ start:662 stop:847 length:186 start_codon:yes stop_codon:yes gene_type:complete
MDKCNINGDFGQCKNNPTKDIFGIELCDNHYHILFNMNENVVTAKQMTKVLEKKLGESRGD